MKWLKDIGMFLFWVILAFVVFIMKACMGLL